MLDMEDTVSHECSDQANTSLVLLIVSITVSHPFDLSIDRIGRRELSCISIDTTPSKSRCTPFVKCPSFGTLQPQPWTREQYHVIAYAGVQGEPLKLFGRCLWVVSLLE